MTMLSSQASQFDPVKMHAWLISSSDRVRGPSILIFSYVKNAARFAVYVAERMTPMKVITSRKKSEAGVPGEYSVSSLLRTRVAA